MSVPEAIRAEVKTKLVAIADSMDWMRLPPASRTRYYDNWTKDPEIGGRLQRYLEPSQVRVYIKDALMKEHARERRGDAREILLKAGITARPIESHSRPHGCVLRGGRLVVWGRANNWKQLMLTAHERTFGRPHLSPFCVILTQAARHFGTKQERAPVEAAARLLRIQKVTWLMD
jgi:hypothetical protein